MTLSFEEDYYLIRGLICLEFYLFLMEIYTLTALLFFLTHLTKGLVQIDLLSRFYSNKDISIVYLS